MKHRGAVWLSTGWWPSHQQEATTGYQLGPLAVKDSDLPVLNGTDTSLVESPSKFFLKGSPISKRSLPDGHVKDI